MSKLVNIADVEIWHTYLGKYAEYFALYNEDVGFYRFGPDNQSDPEARDSFEVDVIRYPESISLFITPMKKYDYSGTGMPEWFDHDMRQSSDHRPNFVEVVSVDLNDPDGPKTLQKKLKLMFELFDIQPEEIEHDLDDSTLWSD